MHKHIHRNRKTPSAPESLWRGRGSLCYPISAHALQKWDFFFRGM